MAECLVNGFFGLFCSLPVGGKIELNVKFADNSQSLVLSSKGKRNKTRNRSLISRDLETMGSCNEEDAYSQNLRTESIFPVAHFIYNESSTYSNPKAIVLRDKLHGLTKRQAQAKKELEAISKIRPGAYNNSEITLSDYDSVDIDTDNIFPPAHLISISSKKKKSFIGNNASTYDI